MNGNQIADIEYRDLPLSEFVNKEFFYMYKKINKNDNLKIGDIYDEESDSWISIDIPQHNDVVNKLPISNFEIAQMISDLQADLIIAGVI